MAGVAVAWAALLPHPVARPDLADPVRRPRLGPRPARGPRPSGARSGRDRGRRERLPVGPRRRHRRAGRWLQPAVDHRVHDAARGGHDHPGLGPAPVAGTGRSPERGRDPLDAPHGRPGLAGRRLLRPPRRVRAVRQRLAPDARWLGVGRLELERPAGPRRDRRQHRPRQLPAGGPLLRRGAADVPLVRRLPRGHRLDASPASTSSRSTSRRARSSPRSWRSWSGPWPSA